LKFNNCWQWQVGLTFAPAYRCVGMPRRARVFWLERTEVGAGKYRGPLHGIPWGGKDLLDTAGIPTTYGAEPFRNRVPKEDAAVVKRLHEAGAVLVAKLSMAVRLTGGWRLTASDSRHVAVIVQRSEDPRGRWRALLRLRYRDRCRLSGAPRS
jgi:hypothetical protein